MRRIEALKAVVEERPSALLICNLGSPSKELFHVQDRSSNFYMLGSMGMASSIGLGLAMASKDREVISIDGDGAVLMNLGNLATIGCEAPQNFLLIIIDNGVYGSTGCQPTAASSRAKLADLAKAAGVRSVREVEEEGDLRVLLKEMKNGVLVVKTDSSNADVPNIPLKAKEIIDRFMAAASPPPG